MKKILLFLSLFIAIKTVGQTIPSPVSPQAVTQMSWYREPSTNKMFANRGVTLGWWQPADSLQVIRIINSLQPATLTFGNGIAKTGTTVGLGSADGSNGLSRATIIAQNGNLFAVGETSLTPNGGQQLSLLNKSFALTSAEDTLFSTVGAGTGTIAARGVQLSANKFNPTTGQVLAKQVLSITGSSIIFLDQIRNKGPEAGGNYEANYTSKSYISKRYADSANANNVKLTGASNQTINDGIRIYNAATSGYTLAIQGMGISNSDYQITTNGANAFFNTFLRNGVSIVGIGGNAIATFNDQNGAADNPNVHLFFPTTAPSFIKSGGTSSQYLMADGSTTTGGGVSPDSVLIKPKNGNDILNKGTFRANLGVPYAKTSFLNYNANTVFLGNSLFYGVEGSISVPLKYAYYSGLGVSKQAYSGQISTTIANSYLADTSNYRKPVAIWIGRNNFTDTTTVQTDIQRIITAMATVGNTKYLILTEINSTSALEWTGTTKNILMTKLNASYSRLWPGHVLDIFTYLFNAYNPGIPQDVTDHGHGVISTSLRILNDTLHLNTNTGELIAKQVLLNNSVLLPTTPSVLTNINYQNSLLNRGHGYDANGIMISDANGVQVQDQNLTWNPSTSVMNLGNSYGLINTIFGNGLLQLGSTSSGKSGSLQIVNSGNATNWELTPISGTTGLQLRHNSGALSTFNVAGTTVGAKLGVNVSNAAGILHTASLSGANASLFESPTGQDINVTFQNAGSVTKSGWQYRTATLETRFINYVNGPMTFFTNSTLGMTLSGTQVLSLVNSPIIPLTGYLKGNNTTAVTAVASIPATDGGTGQTVYAIGDVLSANTTTTLSKVADVATGNVLKSGGVGVLPAYGKVTSAEINSTVMANPMTALGDFVYGGASGAPTRLAGNTTTARQFLTSTGAAGVATAPALFDLFGSSNSWSGVNAFNAQTDFFSSATFRGGTGISFYNTGNTFAVNATAPTLTAARAVTFQDKSGTIALTSDVNRSHTIFSPVTGGTVTTVNNQDNIINPAGTLATLTIALPASPVNNDKVYITFTQAVTAITYSGGTTVGVPLSATLGSQWFLTYDSGTTTWY